MSGHESDPCTEVAIIGGGPSGLALSDHLRALDCDHVVLEQGRVAEHWRTRRWDSLRLVASNWHFGLPGLPYSGDGPDGFMGRDEVVARLCPAQLPPGAVLVVGSGESGCQIADELRRAGRSVYLAVGRSFWLPRRYSDRDCIAWLTDMSAFAQTVDSLPCGHASGAPPGPQLTGRDGGRDLNLRARWREPPRPIAGHSRAHPGLRRRSPRADRGRRCDSCGFLRRDGRASARIRGRGTARTSPALRRGLCGGTGKRARYRRSGHCRADLGHRLSPRLRLAQAAALRRTGVSDPATRGSVVPWTLLPGAGVATQRAVTHLPGPGGRCRLSGPDHRDVGTARLGHPSVVVAQPCRRSRRDTLWNLAHRRSAPRVLQSPQAVGEWTRQRAVAGIVAATRSRRSRMLRIYIAEHCPSCATARLRLAQLWARCPGVPGQLVDIDAPGARVPPHIIGTPMYTWDDRIIFRGNPGEDELIALVAALKGGPDGPGTG